MKEYSFLDFLKELFVLMLLLSCSGGLVFGLILVILDLIFPDNDIMLLCVIYLILCLTIACYIIINMKIAEFQEREKVAEIEKIFDTKDLKKQIEELKKENKELKKEKANLADSNFGKKKE